MIPSMFNGPRGSEPCSKPPTTYSDSMDYDGHRKGSMSTEAISNNLTLKIHRYIEIPGTLLTVATLAIIH
jgi:hypothetical protein